MLQQIVTGGPVVLLPAASASVVAGVGQVIPGHNKRPDAIDLQRLLSAIFVFHCTEACFTVVGRAAAASLSSGMPDAVTILTTAVQPGLA